MEKLLNLHREDIERNLKPETLRQTQVICGSIIAGVIMFFIVCMILYGMSPKQTNAQTAEMEMILLVVMGALLLGMLVAAMIVPAILLNTDRLAVQLKASSADPVEWAVGIHRIVMIIRMVFLEGAALFGLVILMLSVMDRSLGVQPIVWLSVLPMVVLLTFAAIIFPTRAGVAEFIESRIFVPLRQHGVNGNQ